MRKTSRMWRAPARGLPRALTARLLAVVLAVVMAGVLAVVMAGVLSVVMVVVWLVSEISGVGLKGVDVCGSPRFTDVTAAVPLPIAIKTCRLTLVISSELGTIHVAWKSELSEGVTRYRTLLSLHS